MDLTPTELRDLAGFLAKRLTPDLTPLDPMEPPPPGDPALRWIARLEAAQQRGQLGALARRIAKTAPDDANLQQACTLLATEGSLESLALGAVIAGGAALALGAVTVAALFLGWAGIQGAPELRGPEPVVVVAAVAPELPARRRAAPPTPEAPVVPPPAAPPPVAEVRSTETTQAAAQPPVPAAQGRCSDPEGGIVGWWYAGRTPPGDAGDQIVLQHAVNVRLEHPGRHNGFDARTPVTCVLAPGDRVRISGEPVHVPKDAWWVPLRSGDLLGVSSDGPLARR